MRFAGQGGRSHSVSFGVLVSVAIATAVVATVAGGASAPPAIGAERTHVVISGPESDWHPTPGFVLEIGDEEWPVRGSIGVRVVVDLPARVVIRDLRDCPEAFRFTAREGGPGAGYLVTVDAQGAFEVERGHGFSEGPYVPSSPVAACDLPDTSTASGASFAPPSTLPTGRPVSSGGGVDAASSPGPSVSPPPLGSPSPRSAAPPMLPRSESPPSWTPSGPPTLWTERGGVRLEAWVASSVLAPGDWIQVRVRATNTSDRTRLYAPLPCAWSPLTVSADLSGLFDPGIDWPGLAGRFKRELLARGAMPSWQLPDGEEGIRRVALADCAPEGGPRVGRLKPGASVERTWSYRPTYLFRRPLPPGPIALRIRFADWGAGARPDRKRAPIEMEAALLLTGTDPGYPSPAELIDAALRDPRLFAFVTDRPAQRSWVNTSWIGWGAIPSAQARFEELWGKVDDGFVELGLFRDIGSDTRYGTVSIDPWTGEVLAYGEDP